MLGLGLSLSEAAVRGQHASPVFDFAGAAVPMGAAFARASTGTRVDATGSIVSAAVDEARFDYNPVTLALRGLLIEPSRTNLVARSGAIASLWTLSAATYGATTTAPDGSAGGQGINETATTANHNITTSPTSPAGASVFSCYIKAGTRGFAQIYQQNSLPAGRTAIIDLTTGAVTQGTVNADNAVTAVDAGNGWWRVSVAVVDVRTTNTLAIYAMLNAATASYLGVAGTPAIYVWGAQLETASVASSYIPTVAAAVTRAADVLTLSLPNGSTTLHHTFDDASTQDVTSTVAGGALTVPTNLNRPRILRVAKL